MSVLLSHVIRGLSLISIACIVGGPQIARLHLRASHLQSRLQQVASDCDHSLLLPVALPVFAVSVPHFDIDPNPYSVFVLYFGFPSIVSLCPVCVSALRIGLFALLADRLGFLLTPWIAASYVTGLIMYFGIQTFFRCGYLVIRITSTQSREPSREKPFCYAPKNVVCTCIFYICVCFCVCLASRRHLAKLVREDPFSSTFLHAVYGILMASTTLFIR